MIKTRNIYILLTHSGSMFSKAINIYTRDEFTHVSIGLDEDLNELYSFGRLKPYNPIFGGFVHEDIINGTYGRFPNTTCALYSLKVNDIQYKKVLNQLRRFKYDGNKYRYNIIGLVGVMINYPVERKHSYFCSQFVTEVLVNSGIDIIHKPPGLTSPMDFLDCNELEFVYQGPLRTYKILDVYSIK